jgi:hypothetical protein
VNILYVLLIATGVALVLQALLWRHATRKRNAGWVDLGWSGGMVLAAVVLAVLSPPSARLYAVSLLVGCWGLRLALHIYADRLRGGKAEDSRYANLRNHWGEKADRNFFFIFEAQALLVGLFLIPAAVVSRRAGAFPDVWDLSGLLVAVIAAVWSLSMPCNVRVQVPLLPTVICRFLIFSFVNRRLRSTVVSSTTFVSPAFVSVDERLCRTLREIQPDAATASTSNSRSPKLRFFIVGLCLVSCRQVYHPPARTPA